MEKNKVIPRVLLAAPASGSGKTVVSCALMKNLKDREKNVVAFKCGPDYIDPMYHKTIIEIPSINLDSFFLDDSLIKNYFLKKSTEYNGDIAIIEGVMGLYDGLGGISRKGSAYEVASLIDAPVILVVDAKGMGASVVPLIAGFLNYDTDNRIRGIILNKITKGYYDLVKDLIEEELGIKVYGYVPKDDSLVFESRHLGLKLPDEIAQLKDNIENAASLIDKTIDVGAIISLAEEYSFNNSGENECWNEEGISKQNNSKALQLQIKDIRNLEKKCAKKCRLAVAKDEAFCFYYEHNFDILKSYDIELVYFSPIHDKKLPENVHGILFGGGYPELYAKQLSDNKDMLSSIRNAINNNIPSVAECGGFMYLHKELVDKHGNSFELVGAIDGTVSYKGKLVRFGYVNISEETPLFLDAAKEIRAHEFHYYDSTNNGKSCCAKKPLSGRAWDCVHEKNNSWWGFPHLYYASNKKFVENFKKYMEDYRDKI